MTSVESFIGYGRPSYVEEKRFEKIPLAKSISLGTSKRIVQTLATPEEDNIQTTSITSPEMVLSRAVNNTQEKINDTLKDCKIHTEVLEDNYSVETWSMGKRNIPKDVISVIAELFEEGFGYGFDGWGEHMQCPCCEKVFTIEESFGLPQGTYIPLKELKEKNEIVAKCSDHPDEELSYFWDKRILEKELEKKFEVEGGILITLRDTANNVVGYAWCYPADFKTAKRNEFDQFYKKRKKVIRNFKRGVSKELGHTFGNTSEVLVWNSMGIQYGHRSLLRTLKMVYNLMDHVPEEFSQRPIIMEAKEQSSFYRYLRAAGGKPKAKGVKEGYVLMLGSKKVEGYSDFWSYNPVEFREKYNETLKSFNYTG